MPQLKSGILIAVEGIDGSGKSTLTKDLHQSLLDKHYNAILTKEPGGTPLGNQLRTILQNQKIPLTPEAEYLLFAADRAQHFTTLVIPSLQNNKIIISDRTADSSLAYQGYGRGLDLAMINTINQWAMNGITPHITIYVKVPVSIALERIQQRKKLTAFEQHTEFLERVTHGFETIYTNRNDVIVIDGTQSPKIVTTKALLHVEQWIQKTKPYLTTQTIPPAQLWIGPHEVLINKVQTFLQTFFCTHNGCTTCATCTHIAQQQHHAIMWLYPEKQYTITTMQGLFSAIAFSLNQNERFFFVIQKADFLTPTCANKLLKPMEEPPPGYHFLLLAQSSSQILPTVRSRCVTTSFYTTHTNIVGQALFDCFTKQTKTTPYTFLKTLDQSSINERESRELLDALLHYWIDKYKNNHESEHTLYIITTLKKASAQPPMPGSSKIFWKNLFLQIHTKQ